MPPFSLSTGKERIRGNFYYFIIIPPFAIFLNKIISGMKIKCQYKKWNFGNRFLRFSMGLPRKAGLRYNGAGVSAYMTEKRGRKG
jgi:hypothetical protein